MYLQDQQLWDILLISKQDAFKPICYWRGGGRGAHFLYVLKLTVCGVEVFQEVLLETLLKLTAGWTYIWNL